MLYSRTSKKRRKEEKKIFKQHISFGSIFCRYVGGFNLLLDYILLVL